MCPLCHSPSTALFHRDKIRYYHLCSNCQLVFVPKQYHLSIAGEKARYDLHENRPNDAGYIRHLNRLIRPLTQCLRDSAVGLDFGSGPYPLLSELMTRQGFTVLNYDLFYANDQRLLNKTYDFITCVEVIEHLREPDIVLGTLLGLIEKEGYIAVMTGLRETVAEFGSWHYITDPTHICFFSAATFAWIARKYRLAVDIVNNSVIILKRLR